MNLSTFPIGALVTLESIDEKSAWKNDTHLIGHVFGKTGTMQLEPIGHTPFAAIVDGPCFILGTFKRLNVGDLYHGK